MSAAEPEKDALRTLAIALADALADRERSATQRCARSLKSLKSLKQVNRLCAGTNYSICLRFMDFRRIIGLGELGLSDLRVLSTSH